MTDELTIDEFARATSTSVRNVRAYLERGILPPPRMVGRTGLYGDLHIERMSAIQALQREGFSLSAVRVLLEAWQSGISIDQLVGAKHRRSATRSGALDVSALYPATKFRTPGAHSAQVRRRRPLSLLSDNDDRHILLIAPGGSGKSTLAAQLLTQLSGATGWASFEVDDDEPSRFWTTVVIGIRTAVADFGDDLLSRIVGGGNVDAALVDIAAELVARNLGITMVLDDLHNITNADVMRQLRWFLTNVFPTHCRMVVCTRNRPQIGVPRLAVGGIVTELNYAELAFDGAEAHELLLNRLGLEVSPEQADAIAVQADGWPAGIYLAGMMLRNGASAASVIETLQRPDRRIQEYFAEEVLALLSPAHVSFLEEISILERFNAELCDHLRQQSDSQHHLADIEGNMFVVDLDDDRYWKRLHHVFGAVLRTRTATDPTLPEKHIRAASWYREHGFIPEAVHHFFAAREYDDAARLIESIYPLFVNTANRGVVIGHWLHRLPPASLMRSPALSLAAASVAGLSGDQTEMDKWLEAAESLASGHKAATSTLSYVGLMRGCLHFGEVEQALDHARGGFTSSHPADPWLPIQATSLALALLWVRGPDHEILALTDRALNHPAASEQPTALAGAWALRAVVLASHGDKRAEEALRQATEIRARSRIDWVPQAANTWSSTARAHRLLGNFEAAHSDAHAGYLIVKGLAPEKDATGAVVPLLIEVAHAQKFKGHNESARQYEAEAERRLRRIRGPGLLPAMLDEARGAARPTSPLR